MKITAAVTESQHAPFALQELELGDLRPDEVLVRVAAAGICHTDLIMRDQWYPVPLPAVLGHEGAGIVERVGSAVTQVAPGERVGMSFDSCGDCPTCRTGRPSYCHGFWAYNFASSRPDGTSALSRNGELIHGALLRAVELRHVRRRQRTQRRQAARLDPAEVAAPFGCGIQTGAGGVLDALSAPAGSTLAVFGTGAVGLSAIMAGVIAGCTTIIGIDRNPARLELARELGATHLVDTAEREAAGEIQRITGFGVDFSVETTGVPALLRQAVDCLAPRGICGVIGAAAMGTEVSLDTNTILVAGRSIRGIVEGDSVPRSLLPRLIALWEQGKFPVDRMMTYYDFDQIDEAARDAEEGKVIKPVLRIGA